MIERMIRIWVEERDGKWFAVAFHEEQLVATGVGATRERVAENITADLPSSVPSNFMEDGSSFARKTIHMLAELEAGNEANKHFTFSREHLSDRHRNILYAAASIPIGYVTSYGNIALVTGTIAREVGRAMATNPLYPVVPCHRVVGADFSLVGYGGKQDDAALLSKLSRLRAEAKGYETAREVKVVENALAIYPVEWVIRKAAGLASQPDSQLMLFQ